MLDDYRFILDLCAGENIPVPIFVIADTMGWDNPKAVKLHRALRLEPDDFINQGGLSRAGSAVWETKGDHPCLRRADGGISRVRQGRRCQRTDFAVRTSEIFLINQPRPIRSVHSGDGWTPETIADHATLALKADFMLLKVAADVLSWDPV